MAFCSKLVLLYFKTDLGLVQRNTELGHRVPRRKRTTSTQSIYPNNMFLFDEHLSCKQLGVEFDVFFFVFLKGSTENGVQSKQTDCLYLLKNKINPETIRWCIAQKPNLGF